MSVKPARTAAGVLAFVFFMLGAGSIAAVAAAASGPPAPAGTVPRSAIEYSDLLLTRIARPGAPFDKVGRRFAVLAEEGGSFEAWAWPLKLVRNFGFSFLLGSSTAPIEGRDIVRTIDVEPAVTTLTFAHQNFTVRAHFAASVDRPGAVILLAVDSDEPLTVVCSFLPVLQPMWPAGIGGQYAYWDDELKAYLISEPRRMNHGFVGSPAARGISATPAHMLSDVPSQFKIEIADPKAAADVWFPIILAGGKGKRDDVKAVYKALAEDPGGVYREALEHFRKLRETSLRVETPRREFDLAFEWAKVSFDNLLVDNPDLGRGLVAGLAASGTSGRPGFGWFFGGDTYLNSLSLNGFGLASLSREAIEFMMKWQRADGKMAHELSQAAGYVDWWKDYPYGYIHGDTTPYFLVAVADLLRTTGDAAWVRKNWPALKRAFAWCRTTDGDGDGLMDNKLAGLGALEFGSLTGIQTDIYLGAVWVRACGAMIMLAAAAGDEGLAREAGELENKARHAFDAKFWDEGSGAYAYAFNANGARVPDPTPWTTIGAFWDLGTPHRSLRTLARLNASDMTTDWGIRVLSSKSSLYEPLNYNYGAVWPFLTGWTSAALFRHGFVPQGYAALRASIRHTFDNGLGTVTELISGGRNLHPSEGVSHQGFSSGGVAFPFVRGLLGLDVDIPGRTVRFAPAFPADWDRVRVENLRVGESAVSLQFERERDKVRVRVASAPGSGFSFVFSPALGAGTTVRGGLVNGRSADAALESPSGSPAIRPAVTCALSGTDVIEIAFDPAPEILPPDNPTRAGDLDRGLKIVKTEARPGGLKVSVEGLAGETYQVGVLNGDLIASVDGAEFSGRTLVVRFPGGRAGEFLRREIELALK